MVFILDARCLRHSRDLSIEAGSVAAFRLVMTDESSVTAAIPLGPPTEPTNIRHPWGVYPPWCDRKRHRRQLIQPTQTDAQAQRG